MLFSQNTSSFLKRYGLAVGAVAAGLALRYALSSFLGSDLPYVTFFAAVMLAGWYGGIGPGLLASFLSLAAVSYFLLGPLYRLGIQSSTHRVSAALFLAISIFISVLNESRRRARALCDQQLRELLAEAELRRGAEDSLSEASRQAIHARDLWETTLKSIGDGVIATDVAGKITFLNAVAEQVTGWSQAEALGKAVEEVFPIENETTRARVENPIERVRAEGQIANLASHTLLMTRDGRQIPIEDSAAPIRAGGQDVLGAVLVFRDATASRNAETALRKSEERQKLALEAARIGIWDWNVADNHIEWSDQVYAIHGLDRSYSPGELNNYARLVYPEDLERVQRAIEASLQQGSRYDVQFRVVTPDGDVRWVSTKAEVFRNEKNETVRMLGAVIDVTARKQADAEFRQQWLTFDAALSNSPDYIFVLDLEGRFTYANRATLALLHRSLDEVVGHTHLELDYPDDLARRVHGQILHVIETRQPVRDQTPLQLFTEDTRCYEYILVPVLDADGKVEGVAGSTRDITERYRTEEALRRANRELEEFAFVASHDLQEPLRMVNIYSQLILKEMGSQKPELLQFGTYVRDGVHRMEALIHDLLAFSRAVQEEDAPAGTAELSASLADAMTVLKNSIEESGAVIEAEALPAVRGDTRYMSHVFQNLLSNALKYRRSDVQPHIKISTSLDKESAIVAVRDNGIGFDPQFSERIFGLFKRLHKDQYPGTGLGLAICKRIVERSGGRVWAEGRPGEGATFFFALPRIQMLHKLNILLVEDNPGDVLLVKRALEEHRIRHELHVVRDGSEALELFSKMGEPNHPPCPDLVLLDLNLPKVDGPDLLRAFRKHPQCSLTPVIVVSSSDAPHERDRMADLGISGYFRKPSDLDGFLHLGAVVRQVLES